MPPAPRPSPEQPGGAALELRTDAAGQLNQHHLTGATIFGASSHRELKTLAIIVDAVNDANQQPHDHAHHVSVVVDGAVDFQIVRKLAQQPLHKGMTSAAAAPNSCAGSAARASHTCMPAHFVDGGIPSAELHRRAKTKPTTSRSTHCAP